MNLTHDDQELGVQGRHRRLEGVAGAEITESGQAGGSHCSQLVLPISLERVMDFACLDILKLPSCGDVSHCRKFCNYCSFKRYICKKETRWSH